MSVRARFGFSLFANLFKAVITFGTGMLVARSLGPEQYGKMMFLLGTFTAVRQLFDVGSSTAFFTFLSQRQRSRRFVGWYFSWLGLQFLLTLTAVSLLFPASWIQLIWKGEQRNLVILAFFAAYMQSVLWSVILQMGESQRLTGWTQGVAVTVALMHFLLIAIAWWGGWLVICTVFGLMIIEWSIAVAVIVKQLHFPVMPEEPDTPKSVFTEFWRYCQPLVLYSWLGFAYEFADRWLLQTYAGSEQQAYYSVAYQFGAIGAIATSSILNIFWKEIAEAHHQNNHERVTMLYLRVSRGLFFVAAVGAGFLAPWVEDIMRIILGATYVDGASTLMIMFFYPLHQSMGQIGGTMAYATGAVATYVKITMMVMVLSTVLTYFVLADAAASLPGLGLGSLGLASKMVVMQAFSVNALAFYLSRSLDIKFDWLFQPVATLACVAAGLLAYTVSQILIDVSSQIWLALMVAGLLYAILMLVLIGLSPSLVGLHRADLAAVIAMGLRFVHK
ncbi:MAG: lipopolysaccharide biosynthesis protein [Thiothrix sp.]|uniref:lipopolysaccharide biosynthesis protein n=1 Tax=Thiothrix sp. TaxID=1032 RepID=UPI0026052D4E|nr:lipopolysaccharide biosynthesis protein [Thiothrix sp.]MDD5392918.1 lipopolysaccharide biosynthesis protein [Thiothrix sp.]